MSWWYRLHECSRWVRWPVKLAAFALVVLLVLYPKLWLLPRHIARGANLNSVLDARQPGLEPYEADVRAAAPPTAGLRELLPIVERVVYRRKPYAFDWETWGVANYLPTTGEALGMQRADCKGRAVLAAALLRRMGYEAWLAADLQHMWVVTPAGELMSPGTGEKTLEAGSWGTRIRMTRGTLANVIRGLSFGVAVFPLTRELIIVAALAALSLHPWSSSRRRVAGCLLLLLALGLVHDSSTIAEGVTSRPWLEWTGLVALITGWAVLVIGRRATGRGVSDGDVTRSSAESARRCN